MRQSSVVQPPGLDETPDTDFRQFLREKFSMDFEIWSHSKRG